MKTITEINQSKYKLPIANIKMREDWNYKNITRESTDKLKRSLMEDGQLTPLLVNAETDFVIGGHHQYVAIKELVNEGKWKDDVWVEPRVVKDGKHEKVLALKHNTQYDIADKERLVEWGMELIDSEYSLADIPVITDMKEFTLLDCIDSVSPDGSEKEDNDGGKEVECPRCHHKFAV